MASGDERLLLPIILTTAFVIFGAWRSAVKAREVEDEAVDGKRVMASKKLTDDESAGRAYTGVGRGRTHPR